MAHTGCYNIVIQRRYKGVLVIAAAIHKPAVYKGLDRNGILSKVKRRNLERRHCECDIS